jgi:hypothetical protein
LSENHSDFACDGEVYFRASRLAGFRVVEAHLRVEGSEMDAEVVYGLVVIDGAEEVVDVGFVRVDLVVVLLSKRGDRILRSFSSEQSLVGFDAEYVVVQSFLSRDCSMQLIFVLVGSQS